MSGCVKSTTTMKINSAKIINFDTTFLVSKEAARFMMNEKSGSIVNISSTNGIDTMYPESLDYHASKAGVKIHLIIRGYY